MTWVHFAVVISLLGSCSVQSYEWQQHYEDLKKRYSEKVLSEEHVEEMRPAGFRHPPFRCPDMSPSPSVPTSVEFVKAADIKAVAALGDSLTLLAGSKNVDCGMELGGSKNTDRLGVLEDQCGIGANASNVLGIPIEYRDVSYSIGGYGTYEDVITLANILRLFNPNVLGPAPKSTVHGYPTTLNDTGLNLAVTGHNTLNFSEQTRNLIETFKVYPGLSFQEDWKLVTVLIGMNDICDHCKNKTLFSVDNFIHYMTEALDMLMDEVPRLIVNLVQILSMEPLREAKRPTLGCQLQRSFCSCLVLPADGSPELQEVVELNVEFQRRLEQLLYSGRYFKHDFAVVLQPYLTKAQPARKPDGQLDLSFFAPDCFHFSIKGHEELAKGLWNNMFQPEGEKFMIESFTEPVKLACPPGDHPYIYTRPKAAQDLTTTKSCDSAANSLPKLLLPLLALAYLH